MLQAVVTGADFGDREGLLKLVFRFGNLLERTKLIWADMGYQGEKARNGLLQFGKQLEIVRRPLIEIRSLETILAKAGKPLLLL